MEEQTISIVIKTKGEKCIMTDEEIKEWYQTNIEKLFNPEYGIPEIEICVQRRTMDK